MISNFGKIYSNGMNLFKKYEDNEIFVSKNELYTNITSKNFFLNNEIFKMYTIVREWSQYSCVPTKKKHQSEILSFFFSLS